jgi:hypothetical protein
MPDRRAALDGRPMEEHSLGYDFQRLASLPRVFNAKSNRIETNYRNGI